MFWKTFLAFVFFGVRNVVSSGGHGDENKKGDRGTLYDRFGVVMTIMDGIDRSKLIKNDESKIRVSEDGGDVIFEFAPDARCVKIKYRHDLIWDQPSEEEVGDYPLKVVLNINIGVICLLFRDKYKSYLYDNGLWRFRSERRLVSYSSFTCDVDLFALGYDEGGSDNGCRHRCDHLDSGSISGLVNHDPSFSLDKNSEDHWKGCVGESDDLNTLKPSKSDGGQIVQEETSYEHPEIQGVSGLKVFTGGSPGGRNIAKYKISSPDDQIIQCIFDDGERVNLIEYNQKVVWRLMGEDAQDCPKSIALLSETNLVIRFPAKFIVCLWFHDEWKQYEYKYANQDFKDNKIESYSRTLKLLSRFNSSPDGFRELSTEFYVINETENLIVYEFNCPFKIDEIHFQEKKVWTNCTDMNPKSLTYYKTTKRFIVRFDKEFFVCKMVNNSWTSVRYNYSYE